MRDETTNLAFWYPKIRDVVPTPRTHIIRTDLDLSSLVEGNPPDEFDTFCQQLAYAARRVKYPAFLRTGYLSGKHNWRSTCFLAEEADIPQHVAALVEESYLADFYGFPTDTWVVREYVPGPVAFTAFHGMPIRHERRVFVRDGKVVCQHPYWPPDAIEHPSCPEWAEKLALVNTVSDEDLAEILTGSAAAAQVLSGAWSLDWLRREQAPHWLLIDAADAKRSFHWPDCEEA